MIRYRTVDEVDTNPEDLRNLETHEVYPEEGVLVPGVEPDIPTGGAIDLFIGDDVLRIDISEWASMTWGKA